MKNIYMIGNAHIDPVWFWTWQDGYQEVKATFRSALDRMNENPDFARIITAGWKRMIPRCLRRSAPA